MQRKQSNNFVWESIHRTSNRLSREYPEGQTDEWIERKLSQPLKLTVVSRRQNNHG